MKAINNEIALDVNVNREINARLKKIINTNVKYKLINDELYEMLENIKNNFSLKYSESKVYTSLFNKDIIPRCKHLFNIIYTDENTLRVGSRDKLNVNATKFYFVERIFSILDKYHDIISIQFKSNVKYDNITEIINNNLFILLEDAQRELFFNKQIKFTNKKEKEEYKLCKAFINYCLALTSKGNINIDFEHICLCFMFKILLNSGNYKFQNNNKELVEIIKNNKGTHDMIINSDKINPINPNVFNNKMFSSCELIDNGHLKPTNLKFKMYFPLNKKELLFGDIRIRMFSHLLYSNNKPFYIILVEIKNNENYEYIIHKINYYPIPVSGKYIYDTLNTNSKLFNHLKVILGETTSMSATADICVFIDLFMNDKTIKDEQNVLQLYQTTLLDEDISSTPPPICKIYTQDKLSTTIAFLLKYINNKIINKESSVLYYVEKNADELKQFLGVMPDNVIYSNMYNSTTNNHIIIKLIKGVKKYLKRNDKVLNQMGGNTETELELNPAFTSTATAMAHNDEKEDDIVIDIINTETVELLMETRIIKINNEEKILSYHHILSNNFLNILYLSKINIIIRDFNDVSFKDNKINDHVNFIKERSPDYFNNMINKPKNILIKEWYINELNKKYKSNTRKNPPSKFKKVKKQTRRTIRN